MRFDVTDLRLFVSIAETGSITHGAAMVNMALGAASARVRGMEELAGVALLNRERLGVSITPAGRALLQHGRIVLQQLGRMHSELDEFAHGLKGHVRLFSNTNALAEFLPVALSSFLMDNPGVNIDLQEHLSDEIVRSVVEGIADIGIVAGTVDVASLETFPFREDYLVVVVPQGHPLRVAGASRSKILSIMISSAFHRGQPCKISCRPMRCGWDSACACVFSFAASTAFARWSKAGPELQSYRPQPQSASGASWQSV